LLSPVIVQYHSLSTYTFSPFLVWCRTCDNALPSQQNRNLTKSMSISEHTRTKRPKARYHIRKFDRVGRRSCRPWLSCEMEGFSYLRLVWLDYLSIFAVGGLTFGLYWAPTHYSESQIIALKASIVNVSLLDPVQNPSITNKLSALHVNPHLPSWLCGLAVTVIPLMIVAAFQLKFRSLWDFHAGLVGILKTTLIT